MWSSVRGIHLTESLYQSSREFHLKASFLEIHNEEIHDLLDPRTMLPLSRDKQVQHVIRQEPSGIVVTNLQQVRHL